MEQYNEQVESDDIAILLGSLMLLDDGKPADIAMWNEWLASIKKVKTKK